MVTLARAGVSNVRYELAGIQAVLDAVAVGVALAHPDGGKGVGTVLRVGEEGYPAFVGGCLGTVQNYIEGISGGLAQGIQQVAVHVVRAGVVIADGKGGVGACEGRAEVGDGAGLRIVGGIAGVLEKDDRGVAELFVVGDIFVDERARFEDQELEQHVDPRDDADARRPADGLQGLADFVTGYVIENPGDEVRVVLEGVGKAAVVLVLDEVHFVVVVGVEEGHGVVGVDAGVQEPEHDC